MPDYRIRVSGLVDESIVDGPGLRLVIFAQGCRRSCAGCHNPGTHSSDGGTLYRLEELLERYLENPLLDGVTFSGGEPFLQAYPLALLAKMIHAHGGSVITYTGYIFEELARESLEGAAMLLQETDILIDGPYVAELGSMDLDYRGSSNQRLLDRDERARLLRYMDSSLNSSNMASTFPDSLSCRKAG